MPAFDDLESVDRLAIWVCGIEVLVPLKATGVNGQLATQCLCEAVGLQTYS